MLVITVNDSREFKCRRETALAAAVFLLALAVRLNFLWMMAGSPFAQTPIVDAREYHRWALSIAAGQGLLAHMFPHSPVYPLLLSFFYRLFGPNLWAVYAVQAILGALTALLCAKTAWNVTRSLAAMAAVGVLAAASWPFVYFTASILPQVLEAFLVAVCFHALVREEAPSWRAACLAGCALGLAASSRPQLIVAAGAVALAVRFVWKESGWRVLLAFVVPMALMSFAWSLFLFSHGEPLTFMQPGSGIALYVGNHAGATGLPAFYFPGLEHSILHYRAGSAGFVGPREDLFFHAAIGDWLRSDPAGAAALWLRKLAFNLVRCEVPSGEAQPWLVDGTFSLLRRFDFGILLALGLPGLAVTAWRGGRSAALRSIFLLAGLAALSVPGAAARYRIPLLPVLALGAGDLVMIGQEWWIQRRRRALAGLAAAAVAVLAASSWAAAFVRIDPERNLGIALALARGEDAASGRKLLKAEELLRGAVEARPSDWDALWHLGVIRLQLQDWTGAEQVFSELAEARGRDYPYLWSMLTWLKARTNDFSGARDAAAAAYRFDGKSLEGCLRAQLYARLADPRFDVASAVCRCPWDAAGRYPSSAPLESLARTLRRERVTVDLQRGLLETEEGFWSQFEFPYPAQDVRRAAQRTRWGPMMLDCRGTFL